MTINVQTTTYLYIYLPCQFCEICSYSDVESARNILKDHVICFVSLRRYCVEYSFRFMHLLLTEYNIHWKNFPNIEIFNVQHFESFFKMIISALPEKVNIVILLLCFCLQTLLPLLHVWIKLYMDVRSQVKIMFECYVVVFTSSVWKMWSCISSSHLFGKNPQKPSV